MPRWREREGAGHATVEGEREGAGHARVPPLAPAEIFPPLDDSCSAGLPTLPSSPAGVFQSDSESRRVRRGRGRQALLEGLREGRWGAGRLAREAAWLIRVIRALEPPDPPGPPGPDGVSPPRTPRGRRRRRGRRRAPRETLADAAARLEEGGARAGQEKRKRGDVP